MGQQISRDLIQDLIVIIIDKRGCCCLFYRSFCTELKYKDINYKDNSYKNDVR